MGSKQPALPPLETQNRRLIATHAAGNGTLTTMVRVQKFFRKNPYIPPAPRSGGDQQPARVGPIEAREDYPHISFY